MATQPDRANRPEDLTSLVVARANAGDAAGLASRFEPEESLPPLIAGDIALCSPRRRDGKGIRVQVARRQADGSWLRVLDWPEPPT